MPIVIELEFPWQYTKCHDPPKVKAIYQTRESNLNQRRINSVLTDFGVIRWYLNNRLNTVLRKNWVVKNRSLLELELYGRNIHISHKLNLNFRKNKFF